MKEAENSARKLTESTQYLSGDLVTLRPLEEEFRDFYLETGVCTDTRPIKESAFAQMITEQYPSHQNLIFDPSDFQRALMEDEYFQTQLDVSAVEGLRYMPAYWHRHEFFEVAVVMSGTVRNFYEREFSDLHAGDVLIMPPGSEHAVCSYNDDAILVNLLMRSTTFEHHFLNLLPNSDLLYGFFVKALYSSPDTPYLLFHSGRDSIIKEDVKKILFEFNRNNRYKNTMLTSLVSIFFVDLLRRHEKDVFIPTINKAVMNEDMIFIIEYMQQNFNTITLKHLSAFFNYSERQIQRIIRMATGLSFSENILNIRMQHAKTMLQEKNWSVQQIAECLGYYDASSFRHAFRNYTGMTPQEFRSLHCDRNVTAPY